MANKKTNVEPVAPPTAVPVAPPATPTPPAANAAAFSLDASLRWKAAGPDEQKVLENLQGNILKGHGRDQTMNIFFKLGSDVRLSKQALRELGNFFVTSAYKQLLDTEAFKAAKGHCEKACADDGSTFCALFLSATGYKALQLTFTPPADNAAFLPGMKAGQAALSDPPSSAWEPEFQKVIDGMVLVADDNVERGAAVEAQVERILTDAGATIVKKQAGKAIKNKVGNGLEHFGYVDGRSQPLMLIEDIEAESRDEGIAFWDPTAKLSKALVVDPLANDPLNLSFGSFFIFRKLEEKVRAFKRKEQELATALGLTGDARELAGALVVGRFEDGTPVTLSDEARGMKAPKNDFNYNADAAAARCPFHAHIRKTNPRGSGGFEPLGAEQLHIMARRGITYEDKARVHPNDLPEAESMAEFTAKVEPLLPEGDVGLLFMAYNAKLDQQFVFTQKSWANSTGFPRVPAGASPPGMDGTIGQPPTPGDVHHYVKEWDNPASPAVTFKGFNDFVIMKGGEYFFAPSLHFLRGL
jgi:Dyp-type peroxidase family